GQRRAQVVHVDDRVAIHIAFGGRVNRVARLAGDGARGFVQVRQQLGHIVDVDLGVAVDVARDVFPEVGDRGAGVIDAGQDVEAVAGRVGDDAGREGHAAGDGGDPAILQCPVTLEDRGLPEILDGSAGGGRDVARAVADVHSHAGADAAKAGLGVGL